ncbi:MAG TPA: hypothetical protein PKK64_03580 [Saprospiraceae bacterium]|nr:hypothetical protein [Saprospiraceae bacterium]HNA64703.1 hypothetical protein [Saprospiraceae bacterium]HNB31381.1 hypothetical protein [Saprospiraceae bacterium]HNG67680.1 hypothetical protein [Saprospiraceae bacterium]HNM52709.1 hypothetical protein [Saprospiraceae bacterium]
MYCPNIKTLVLLFLSIGSINAQYASEKSILSVAQKSMASKNYYDALSKFKELLEFDENNAMYLYQAAEAARFHGAYGLAASYYGKVLSGSQNQSYPQAAFRLAQVQQLMGDYNNSKNNYQLYISTHSGEEQSLSEQAQMQIQACEWAITQKDNENKEVKIKRLGDEINSQYSDFAATGNDKQIFYSSNRFINEVNKLFPQRTISRFLVSRDGGPGIKKDYPSSQYAGLYVANASFSQVSNRVVFTLCEEINDFDKRCKLYLARIDEKGNWSEPQALPDNINLPDFNHTQPSLSFDSSQMLERLYYCSDRPGGKGMLDLWTCSISADGAFSEPVNLTEINTAFDEATPYFDTKTKLLYFSSRGYLSMGGYDIYYSRNKGGLWTNPVNLGVPVNTSYDELYFYRGDDRKVFFSSNRTESKLIDDINNACCLDIYRAIVPDCDVHLKTLVYDANTKEDLIGATINIVEISAPRNTGIIQTNEKGNDFIVPLDCDKEYKLIVSKQGYEPDSVTFLSGKPGEFAEILKKIYLRPEKINLDVLTFDKQTGADLPDVTLQLIDLDDPLIPPVTVRESDANISHFIKIEKCHRYRIVANKDKYAETSKEIKIDCKQTGLVTEKIYLDKFLYSMLPLTLYFDNDRPRPNGKPSYTNLSYSQTFSTYYHRKSIFKKKYALLFGRDESVSREQEMESFFEIDVKGGKEKLDLFVSKMATELAEGKKYIVYIKGYASPLASDDYNKILGQRRIQSVRNEFARYHKGILMKYINSGLIEIREKTFGEETSPKGIASEPKDPGSIYHINASRERRVEIIEIKE